MTTFSSSWPYPRWIAHRGAGKLAPENTLAAFRLGASHGYRAFECDVKLSADGVPFLLHDPTLERTTNGQGTAGLLPWAELSRLDAGSWHGRAHAGEPLPTLEGLTRWLRANGLGLNIEIKPTPGEEARTGTVVATEAARLWLGAPVPPLLSSFRPEALLAARHAAPHLPRALLLDTPWDGWASVAETIGVAAVVTNHAWMTAEVLAGLHAKGWRGLVYTVNEADRAAQLMAIGIDGLITDAVDRFAPAQDVWPPPVG